ncbi:MAG: HdeD family acid-resistance protein [Aestuariivirga sp.]|uniref:HdeD family acid-resistance protein n=1 Tax=Aestuariivirga sp. TaxID=2650926 RepID=UPI00301718F3
MTNNVTNARGLGAGALLLHGLAKHWWVLALRGVAAIVFGVLAFAWPGITILSLVMLYGAYAFVDGVFSIFAAIGGGTPAPRWWLAVVGILGILAGLIAFANPVLVGLYLLWFIGAWAIVSGVMEIIGAIRLRKEIDNEWWLILHGLISVLFGIFLFAEPLTSALALIWVIGAYAVAAGVIMIMLAFKLKGHSGHAK